VARDRTFLAPPHRALRLAGAPKTTLCGAPKTTLWQLRLAMEMNRPLSVNILEHQMNQRCTVAARMRQMAMMLGLDREGTPVRVPRESLVQKASKRLIFVTEAET